MIRGPALCALVALPLLSGCVAALLPLAAAGAIGKGEIDRAKAKREFVAVGAVDLGQSKDAQVIVENESQTSNSVDSRGLPANGEFEGQGGGIETGSIGLDESSSSYLSRFFRPIGPEASPFAGFAAHALEKSALREAGENVGSAVLIPRVDIFKPKTIGCGGKPLAVMIDLDNEDQGQWMNADILYRQNGLVEALRSLRAAEISVIWLSDEPVAASQTIASILREGDLAEPNADDFLFLDRGGDDRKQERRWDAARNYCIVAIAGDKRSDFDELYDYLRDPNGAVGLEHMFDNGWFITPPPLVVAETDLEMAKTEEDK